MHMYQKHVLDLLRTSDTRRYTELQPDGVESSHFKYHLNQLISQKLVNHSDRGVYSLTTIGKSFVDRMSENSVIEIAIPKLITYTLIEDETYFYLQLKHKEPFKDLLNMVGGKVHVGELSQEAAFREIEEKVGDCRSEPVQRGVAEIIIYNNNLLYTHAVAHIFSIPATDVEHHDQLERVAKDNVFELSNLAPDFLKIIEHLSENKASEIFSVVSDFDDTLRPDS